MQRKEEATRPTLASAIRCKIRQTSPGRARLVPSRGINVLITSGDGSHTKRTTENVHACAILPPHFAPSRVYLYTNFRASFERPRALGTFGTFALYGGPRAQAQGPGPWPWAHVHRFARVQTSTYIYIYICIYTGGYPLGGQIPCRRGVATINR